MATHSSILAWKTPWATVQPESNTAEATEHAHTLRHQAVK